MRGISPDAAIAFAFGLAFVVTMLVLAVRFPHPTPFQYSVFRTVLSLAAAGVGAMLPGLIDLEFRGIAGLLLRAGGALAVFVIIFFFNPAKLVPHKAVNPAGPQAFWPEIMTRKALEAKLRALSEIQWKIMEAVERRDGQAVHHVTEEFHLGPSETYHRLRSLEADRLVIIHNGEVHLSADVKKALGRRRLIELRPSNTPKPPTGVAGS